MLKKVFLGPKQKKKDKQRHLILHNRISSGTKFQVELTILVFWTRLIQKGFFQSKTNKLNTTIEFCKFELVKIPDFNLEFTILSFWNNFSQKGIIPVKNRKSEHLYWVLHVRISLATKFQFKLTFFYFLTNFAQKGNFQSKTENLQLSILPWSLLTILNFSAGGSTDTTGLVRLKDQINNNCCIQSKIEEFKGCIRYVLASFVF